MEQASRKHATTPQRAADRRIAEQLAQLAAFARQPHP
jgi:hypothetical protein